MSLNMQAIINNLLASDNETIQKGTEELKIAFQSPECILQLCDIVVSQHEPQVRQYSAVLLRKRLGKLRTWQEVPQEQQQIIKKGMLTAMLHEKEKPVRTAIAGLIGALVRHEASRNDSWMKEILQVIYTHCSSADPVESELGSSIFAVLTDAAPDQFLPYMESICEMFVVALGTCETSGGANYQIVYNILNGMTNLVPFILGHNLAEQTYQKSVNLIIKSLQGFAHLPDTDIFIRAFDILEAMADYTPNLLTNNIRTIMDFCLEVSSNPEYASSVRVRTVSYIGWMVRLKKKVLIKLKYVEPIIRVTFNLMCSESESEEEDEDYYLGDDSQSPMTTATQTMDLLALNIPPEKLIPPLLSFLEPALQGQNPLARRAAYLCMAVIAEGCSDAICNKYLENMLVIIKNGIVDQTPIVRNAAFFALGQFSEHLQPEITKYAQEILPVMFDFLSELCVELKKSKDTTPKHIDRMFYALETYCESLGEGLVPYLPLLMERLMETLDHKNSVHVRELAMSMVSAAASATKAGMMPYFDVLINMIKFYLIDTADEDTLHLRPYAINTLASLARTVGRENFWPLAEDSINYALTFLQTAEDPEMRRALYNLFASLADVLKEDMGRVYPQIMERIYDSIISTDEVIPEYKDDSPVAGLSAKNIEDDCEIDIEFSDDEEDEDGDGNMAAFSVENAFLDEKEEAILSLREFAEHTGKAFLPYIQNSFENVYKQIDHPQDNIRKVAVDTLAAFILAMHKEQNVEGAAHASSIFVPRVARMINEDEEVNVVLGCFDALTEVIKELRTRALPNSEMCDTIYDCIGAVLAGKCACQFEDPELGADGNSEGESEYDQALIDAAGSLFPALGMACEPKAFAMYFERLSPTIMKKLENAHAEDIEGQRCFVYGTIAECLEYLKPFMGNYFQQFLTLFLTGLKEKNDKPRQNAIFGLGELILNSGELAYGSYNVVLHTLSEALAKEKNDSCLDNIVGAIARLILANRSLVPLEQVIPVFFARLPLRQDLDENEPVFNCITMLYMNAREVVVPHLEQVLAIAIHVLYKNQNASQPTHDMALSLIRQIRGDYPDKYTAVTSVNPDIISFLHTLPLN